jgi:hypothetical protein
MSNPTTTAPQPSRPVTIEKPTRHTGSRDKTRAGRNGKISRSVELGKKVMSISGTERRAWRSKGSAIKGRGKGNDEGGDETNLSVCFQQFW